MLVLSPILRVVNVITRDFFFIIFPLLISISALYVSRFLMLRCIKNVEVTVVPLDGEVKQRYRYDRKRELRNAVLAVILFWLPVIVLYVGASEVFGSYIMFLFVPLIAAAVFFLFCLVSNPFTRYSMLRRRRKGVVFLRSLFMLSVVGGVVVLLMNGFLTLNGVINSFERIGSEAKITYNTENGVYTVTRPENRPLRILQLTDIHITGGIFSAKEDNLAITACEKLIRATSPDLVIVTGDLAYPIGLQTLTKDNSVPFIEFSLMMEKLDIPWAFTFGNHDNERGSVYSGKQLVYMLSSLYSAKSYGGKLLMANVQPDIFGRYNQYIRVENEDGELERLLFLIDSNDYDERGEYDCIHEDQVVWYENISKEFDVGSFVFIHIPLREYEEAHKALLSADGNTKYLFGENIEGVCCSKKPSRMFSAMLENKTDAVFCGHDHLNNMGLRYQGLDLVYGMSIDYIAYPGISEMTSQRGATLIECDGEKYTVTQIPLK